MGVVLGGRRLQSGLLAGDVGRLGADLLEELELQRQRRFHDEQDAASVTRDYRLELDTAGAPLLSVFGGKITTYRKLAEEALDQLLPILGRRARNWTASAPLPGGDIPNGDFYAFVCSMHRRYPWFSDRAALRLARSYGTRVDTVLRRVLTRI